jgi:hypothetical protein
MARFAVVITGRERFPHVECFYETARALAKALQRLGHEVTDDPNRGRLIIFGANNLHQVEGAPIPSDAILFNSEQLAAVTDPGFFMQGYLAGSKTLTVWDYSAENVKAMKEKLGITRAVHCPLGYVPEMTTIEKLPPDKQDIDVLHYGSIGDSRRKEILDGLDKEGLNVVKLFGVYGQERDAYIARAKIVINLHYYPNGVFEIFRVSHLLANKKCVVTEAGGCDPQLEKLAEDACRYTYRAHLVEACKMLCGNASIREMYEQRGFAYFSAHDFVESVRQALEQSGD